MASGVGVALPALVLFTIAALLNTAWTYLSGCKPPKNFTRLLSVLVDLLVGNVLFVLLLSHGVYAGWVGLLPLISAAVYFRWWGVLAVAVLNFLLQGAAAGLVFSLPEAFFQAGIFLLASLISGLPLAYWISHILQTTNSKEHSAPGDSSVRAEQESKSRISRLISGLRASLNFQDGLETALDLSASTLASMDAPVDRLVSAALLFAQQEQGSTRLQTTAARGFSLPDMRLTISGTSGFIAKVIDEGTPGVTTSIRNDPDLNQFVALSETKAVYCAPLRSGLDTYGVILFAHPDDHFFLPARREILDIVSSQAAIALQNAILFRDLKQEKERMIEVQENSRKKLARELHDGPTQTVAAIAMRVNFARRLMDQDAKAAVEELQKIEDLARKTTKEIRHMLFTLRPLVLETQGLGAALASMAGKMKETFNQDVSVEVEQRVLDILEQTKQGVIFYIAEEAVNNARKHAQAKHIAVRLKLVGEDLCFLEIQDDGVGFNPDAVDASYGSRGSLGMLNMRERTELVNGVLRLESSPGSGTRVQVAIPLTEAAADRLRRGAKAKDLL